MRRIFLAVALGALLVGATAVPSRSQDNGPIKIGILAERTGFFSLSGEDIFRGARLFADVTNAAGGINGRQIELVVQDTASEPERAVVGAKKLIEQDKVTAIVGLGFVADAVAVAPVIGPDGPILYTIGIFNPPPDKPMVFASDFDVGALMQGSMLSLQKMHKTKVALISTNDATGQAAERGFRALAGKYGLTPVDVEFFNPSATSVVAELSKINAAGPDAVIAWTVGRATGVIAVGAQQLGMSDIQFVTTIGNLSGAFLKQVSDMDADFFMMAAPKDSFDLKYVDAKDPQYGAIKKYRDEFIAKWKIEPGPLAGGAWDAMSLVSAAIAKAGTDPKAIAKQLENTQGFVGVQGVFNISAQNHRGIGVEFLVPMKVTKGRLAPAN